MGRQPTLRGAASPSVTGPVQVVASSARQVIGNSRWAQEWLPLQLEARSDMPGVLRWLVATFRGRTVSPAQPLALGPSPADRDLRTFLLGVAGADYANLDGTSRQKIIKRC